MLFGYVRVSTARQAREGNSLEAQKAKLLEVGVPEQNVFVDVISGRKASRPALDDLLSRLREDDLVVSTKLDRLGRDSRELHILLGRFKSLGADFRTADGVVETKSLGGKLLFAVMAAIAEFELETTLERSSIGRESARAQGKLGGRPKKLTPELVAKVKDIHVNPLFPTAKERWEALGISKTTYYEALKL
ncbi:recombinase family protein [Pseudoclavibacter chungangensis]|uniref:Recombinase family protein n=1 Tax=Pseudoclavibacter chungangensis TaxID=587635 RepID=A0A7J5BLT3_9MICO|nr:recombinase family protein [Pseudoclavibacter chungangensis]KAB1651663.1 recombinase family protein [Pseudoclavibacter chungangensis]NYJ65962.1 DNA invertase Pin-like site-specific DNA recombinase [Pseudoclavibacter chungangensis]